MAHPIYTTPALVLTRVPWGDANALLSLFTRELGLVKAQAKSVRELRSKMRFHTQELAAPDVCLIRGREFFRLVGINEPNRLLELSQERSTRLILARLFKLLERLIPGEEEPLPDLFDDVLSATEYLKKGELTPAERGAFEAAATLRVLYHLGYLDPADHWQSVIEAPTYSGEVITELGERLPHAKVAIRQALHDSQL